MSKFMTSLRYRLLPRSLFGRSLMIIAMPILLMQMIVGFIFFDRHWDSMTNKLATSLAGEIGMVTESMREEGKRSETDKLIASTAKQLELLVTLREGKIDGQTLHDSFFPTYWFSASARLERALERKLDVPFIVRPYENDRWFEVIVQLDDKRMASFLCHDTRLTSYTTYIFILWMIGSAVVLFGIAILFMRNQIRPIMRLAVAAEKLGKGQDVPDFKPVGATEVRQAAKAFLEMKDRLRRQIEQRTAMLSGVSHDLRTPLTRIRLQLAMMADNPDIANIRQDLDEMEKMIEGYLTFAKGDVSEATEMTDLRPVMDRIAANARRQGYDVQENFADRLLLRVRPVSVERAISNIVMNACKYAKHVWINAYVQGDMVEITVDDDGPGIPADQREDVFRPFFRLEKSRNKMTGGIGLGLSIAQDIVHSHGGEIILEDSNRGGLRAVIRLPL